VRISGDFDIPVGLKTRKVFSLAAKIISSQFYQTQRLVLCHTSCTMREPLTQTFLLHSAPLQTNITQAVADACHELLYYIATHPNTGI
jgi:hypothetical protein